MGAFGHCAGYFLAEPGYWASTVAPALGALRCLRSSSSTSWWWRLSWSTSSCASLLRLLEFCLFLGVARALRTWKMVHYSPAPCFWQSFLGVWVLLVGYGALDSSGDDFVRGAMLGLTVDAGLATILGFWKNFTYFQRRRGLGFWRFFSTAEWKKYAQSMLRFEPLHALFALGVQTSFPRAHELDPV